MSYQPCRSCRQPYEMDDVSRDPYCSACREQIAVWHAPERLNGLAQQGFEEAMGMRPPSNLYPDLPADAGLMAGRWEPGAAMVPQQMTGVSEGRWESTDGPDPILEGQIRCRHCAAVLMETADATWIDPRNESTCPEIGIPHLPMPEGLAGGQN